jgi:ribosome-binding protein aMBF1 (putative translation factor)
MYSAQLTIERIQTAIKRNNTTQKKLSADLDISENTIKRMTDNKGISSFDAVNKL